METVCKVLAEVGYKNVVASFEMLNEDGLPELKRNTGCFESSFTRALNCFWGGWWCGCCTGQEEKKGGEGKGRERQGHVIIQLGIFFTGIFKNEKKHICRTKRIFKPKIYVRSNQDKFNRGRTTQTYVVNIGQISFCLSLSSTNKGKVDNFFTSLMFII